MPGVAERTRTAALLLLTPLFGSLFAGCSAELVRPSVTPPAVEARPVEAPLETAVLCQALRSDSSGPSSSWEPYYMPPLEDLTQVLVKALGAGGVFGGDVLATEQPDRPAQCAARLTCNPVSVPEPEERPYILVPAVFSAGLLAPLCLIWTDREPDLVDAYVLEVVVRGDEAVRARYEAVARGTISAQQTRYATDEIRAARVTLAEMAARSLVAQFGADEAAHARLRAALSDEPAAELEPLLVTKETFAPRARWRTRRIIRWKTEALAGHVAEAKASELRTLVGTLEGCMVDLAHEAETSKDAAQVGVAGGADDALATRELSLAYAERLEVLRPILAAVKEELDARGR